MDIGLCLNALRTPRRLFCTIDGCIHRCQLVPSGRKIPFWFVYILSRKPSGMELYLTIPGGRCSRAECLHQGSLVRLITTCPSGRDNSETYRTCAVLCQCECDSTCQSS
eukprot:3989203-Amphidinium_carterae.2